MVGGELDDPLVQCGQELFGKGDFGHVVWLSSLKSNEQR
jgi:hypothetical protein